MNCPLDYSLCNQTVTLYFRRGETIRRQVVENACYSYCINQVTQNGQTRQETSFRLIIPGDPGLQPGDRVMEGIGPESVDWDRFVPVCVPSLAQVAYVAPYCWQGQICHTVAGRK